MDEKITYNVEKFTHIHHLSESYLNSFYQNFEPVFVLNTGRSGSAFIQSVLKNYPTVEPYHEASPNLFLLSNFAFSNQNNYEVLKKIFEASRIELMLQVSLNNKIYLESNQCLVFYAKQIKEVFPKAKFVHLTRHPGNFVRSAIMKGWHKNDSVWELGRIKMSDSKQWSNLSQIEKLAWVWNETHNLIENFKTTYFDSFKTFKLEDLTHNVQDFENFLNFIGVKSNYSSEEIKKFINKKINEVSILPNEPDNMFKLNVYPTYENWNFEEKESLKKYASVLALKYNYKL